VADVEAWEKQNGKIPIIQSAVLKRAGGNITRMQKNT
jgi:hypothetical protein